MRPRNRNREGKTSETLHFWSRAGFQDNRQRLDDDLLDPTFGLHGSGIVQRHSVLRGHEFLQSIAT
jgi:hypothetical protein